MKKQKGILDTTLYDALSGFAELLNGWVIINAIIFVLIFAAKGINYLIQ
jgi:hypothetical protein